jgi:hypothetical protein
MLKIEYGACSMQIQVPGMAGIEGPGQPTEVLCLLSMVMPDEPAGTNPRCVNPSSDHFGTILNESIDLHLLRAIISLSQST